MVAGANELGNMAFYKDARMAYIRKDSAQQGIQRRESDAKTRTIAIPYSATRKNNCKRTAKKRAQK